MRFRSVLTSAVAAPFNLAASAGRALYLSLAALVVLILAVFLAHYFGLSDTAMTVVLLMAAAATVWFIFEFQRHLLLGEVASPENEPIWKRLGIYSMFVLLLSAAFSAMSGVLLAVAMPAIALLLSAAAGNQPWIAAGSLVVYGLCLAIAAYPVARMALVLPALAAGHEFDPQRIWRLTHGNGTKLLVLVVVFPGALQLLATTAFTDDSVRTVRIVAGIGISSVYFVFSAALVASAYFSLSDIPLPGSTFERKDALANRAAAFVLVLLVGTTIAFQPMLNDGRGNTSISDPERFSTGPAGTYSAAERTTLLTSTKQTVSLSFSTEWRIANPDQFMLATGDNVTAANLRLTDASISQLRNTTASKTFDEIRSSIDRVNGKVMSAGVPLPDSLFADGADEIVKFAGVLGIEIVSFSVEIVEP